MVAKLLIHSAEWQSIEPSYTDTPITKSHALGKVRVSVGSKLVSLGNQGATRQDSATLFFFLGKSICDGVSELPAFAIDDIILFEGVSWHIRGVKKLYSDKGFHHLEVELV